MNVIIHTRSLPRHFKLFTLQYNSNFQKFKTSKLAIDMNSRAILKLPKLFLYLPSDSLTEVLIRNTRIL